MGVEIERKYKVKDLSFKNLAEGILYRQGYLAMSPNSTVRVRVYNNRGFLTVKGAVTGFERAEFEYEIPFDDAQNMLDSLCHKPIIEKYRYKINYEGFTWEVDEFIGENSPLVIAEIELSRPDEKFPVPEWVGEEVTGDKRYYNSKLVKNPYSKWLKED